MPLSKPTVSTPRISKEFPKNFAKPAPATFFQRLRKKAKGIFFLPALFTAAGAVGGSVGVFAVWELGIAPQIRALVNTLGERETPRRY